MIACVESSLFIPSIVPGSRCKLQIVTSTTLLAIGWQHAGPKETIGQDSTAERDAVRRLNMAVQLLEYRIAGPLSVSADNTG